MDAILNTRSKKAYQYLIRVSVVVDVAVKREQVDFALFFKSGYTSGNRFFSKKVFEVVGFESHKRISRVQS